MFPYFIADTVADVPISPAFAPFLPAPDPLFLKGLCFCFHCPLNYSLRQCPTRWRKKGLGTRAGVPLRETDRELGGQMVATELSPRGAWEAGLCNRGFLGLLCCF